MKITIDEQIPTMSCPTRMEPEKLQSCTLVLIALKGLISSCYSYVEFMGIANAPYGLHFKVVLNCHGQKIDFEYTAHWHNGYFSITGSGPLSAKEIADQLAKKIRNVLLRQAEDLRAQALALETAHISSE